MSMYINKLSFGLRTIQFYNKADKTDFEFTASVGVLLNVFSVICPENGKFIEEIDADLLKRKDKIPQFNQLCKSEGKSDIEDYFKNLRNGLAHKTEDNFAAINDADETIKGMKISSRDIPDGIKLNFIEINSIITLLEEILEEKLSTRPNRGNAYPNE